MSTPGPQPGQGCLTCEHPDAGAINALLNEGKLSNRAIARRYGLKKDTVSRHLYKRHPGVNPARSATIADIEGEDEKTQLDRLKEIRASLETEMGRAPRADLSRELRQVSEKIAELEGTDRPVEMTILDVRGLPEQVRRWFEALEPYPDAREAMFLATDPKLLEEAGVAP
jgi:DNA-binding transcriptional ArsR family regulator